MPKILTTEKDTVGLRLDRENVNYIKRKMLEKRKNISDTVNDMITMKRLSELDETLMLVESKKELKVKEDLERTRKIVRLERGAEIVAEEKEMRRKLLIMINWQKKLVGDPPLAVLPEKSEEEWKGVYYMVMAPKTKDGKNMWDEYLETEEGKQNETK